jgi:hypothetical protein
MPRNDQKAYTSLTARIPQDLADEAKRYAGIHRLSVSELIRDGLEMRLEAGDVPGRGAPQRPTPEAEVLHEVLRDALPQAVREVLPAVIHEVLQTLAPRITAQFQEIIRKTVAEVLHGKTSLPTTETQGLTEVIPPFPLPVPQTMEGMTTVLPLMPISPPIAEVIRMVPASSQPAGEGHTEVLPQSADFDHTRFALGKLCPNRHAYQSTGQTLYRLPKYVCPPCDADRARARRARQKALRPEG